MDSSLKGMCTQTQEIVLLSGSPLGTWPQVVDESSRSRHCSLQHRSLFRFQARLRYDESSVMVFIRIRQISVFLLLLALVLFPVRAETVQEDQGVTGFGLALRKLGTVGSVLYVTAHPDDENNALLVKLSRGQGFRTGLLTLTRGDGGQNEIGPELFEALGVLRTQELMTIHRYDGAEQFFTRAFEFGYSFSVEETLEKWGEEEILRDMVHVIRSFRPQVMISLSPEGTGGGQHHQTSARLAAKAFRLAADPNRFPDQLGDELRPWQALRLFQTSLPGQKKSKDPSEIVTVAVDLGTYDRLLGESFAEFGARARGNHRCQGMNVLPDPSPSMALLRLADQVLDLKPTGASLFEDLDLSLRSISVHDSKLKDGLGQLEKLVSKSQEAYRHSNYSAATETLSQGLELVRKLKGSTKHPEARFLLESKQSDFVLALEKGHFLYFDSILVDKRDGTLVPGEEFEVATRFRAPEGSSLSMDRVYLLQDSQVFGDSTRLEDSRESSGSIRSKMTVPPDSEPTQPYWYRSDPAINRFSTQEGFQGTEAVSPPFLKARLEFRSGGVPVVVERPVRYRWFDAELGRARESEIQIVPELSVVLKPTVRIVAPGKTREKEFQVTVRNNRPGKIQARVFLEISPDWAPDPLVHQLQFNQENESIAVIFRVRVPEGVEPGEYPVQARAESGGETYSLGYQVIDYHHIQTRHLYRPAKAVIKAFPLNLPRIKVGYIMGVGDEVGKATEELGLEVTYLDRESLAVGDLGAFDVIVTGVRAYLNREDLRAFNHRLLQYVSDGGHLVVQYNKYEFNQAQYGPYPSKIDRPHDRVTDEDSPIRILEPDHPIFVSPNKLTDEDWQGWVQERGLYFWGEWDPQYQPLLELQDPWRYNREAKRGSLLIAQYGTGTYVYTGLSLFRQLPAGVPGAFRLWVNLLSLGQAVPHP